MTKPDTITDFQWGRLNDLTRHLVTRFAAAGLTPDRVSEYAFSGGVGSYLYWDINDHRELGVALSPWDLKVFIGAAGDCAEIDVDSIDSTIDELRRAQELAALIKPIAESYGVRTIPDGSRPVQDTGNTDIPWPVHTVDDKAYRATPSGIWEFDKGRWKP